MAVIELSQAATDIIMKSVVRIETFDSNYYPTAEGLANYVNDALPPDEKVTIEDINIASTLIAQKYPTLLGAGTDQLTVTNTLVSAFKSAMAPRMTATAKESSLIMDFSIIFVAVLLGYALFKGGK